MYTVLPNMLFKGSICYKQDNMVSHIVIHNIKDGTGSAETNCRVTFTAELFLDQIASIINERTPG